MFGHAEGIPAPTMESIFLFKGEISNTKDGKILPKTTHEELMEWLNTLIPAAI